MADLIHPGILALNIQWHKFERTVEEWAIFGIEGIWGSCYACIPLHLTGSEDADIQPAKDNELRATCVDYARHCYEEAHARGEVADVSESVPAHLRPRVLLHSRT